MCLKIVSKKYEIAENAAYKRGKGFKRIQSKSGKNGNYKSQVRHFLSFQALFRQKENLTESYTFRTKKGQGLFLAAYLKRVSISNRRERLQAYQKKQVYI